MWIWSSTKTKASKSIFFLVKSHGSEVKTKFCCAQNPFPFIFVESPDQKGSSPGHKHVYLPWSERSNSQIFWNFLCVCFFSHKEHVSSIHSLLPGKCFGSEFLVNLRSLASLDPHGLKAPIRECLSLLISRIWHWSKWESDLPLETDQRFLIAHFY